MEDALHELREAHDAMERHQERYFEAELHRLMGELLVQRERDGDGDAERWFRSAIDIARRQHATSLELRAATSLGRFLRRRRRHGESRDVLSGVFGRFTEGFDLPDLREAAVLLETRTTRAATVQ
jgi:predicted ATPase